MGDPLPRVASSSANTFSQDPRLIPLGFAAFILVGAAFLSTPWALQEGVRLGFLDALFLATSAVCVTGLSTVDVASVLSPFGQGVLLVLIQGGGLGIVTAGTLLALMGGEGLSLRQERSIHATMGRLRQARPVDVFLYACAAIVIVELAGTLMLFERMMAANPGESPEGVLWQAGFHAVSAFCNAGLSISPRGMVDWRDQPDVLAVVIVLVVSGGIGLLTLVNLRYFAFWRRDPRRRGYLTLQTKISVSSALVLLVVGALVTLLLEFRYSQAGRPWEDRLSWSIFHSAMTRTAGFNVSDLADMHPATLLFTMVLMFVGGAPGSMAGGVKTVTFVLLLMSAWSALMRREDIQLFGRRIHPSLVGTAVMVTLLGAASIVAGTLLLMITEQGLLASETKHHWLALAFEAVSAFGTVGLSTGVTPSLSSAGKLIVVVLMFAGRVGPLLLSLRLSRAVVPWKVRPPLEDLALG